MSNNFRPQGFRGGGSGVRDCDTDIQEAWGSHWKGFAVMVKGLMESQHDTFDKAFARLIQIDEMAPAFQQELETQLLARKHSSRKPSS